MVGEGKDLRDIIREGQLLLQKSEMITPAGFRRTDIQEWMDKATSAVRDLGHNQRDKVTEFLRLQKPLNNWEVESEHVEPRDVLDRDDLVQRQKDEQSVLSGCIKFLKKLT